MFVTGEAAPVGFGVKEVSEVGTGLLAGGGGGVSDEQSRRVWA